jgi:glycosyltransferase involved in cell wall biosynthesis
MVVCPEEGVFVERLRQISIPIEVIPMPQIKSFHLPPILSTLFKFRNLIKKRRIDLVHANDLRAALYSGRAARWQEIPFLWHVRVMESGGVAEKLAFSLADKVIVNSQAVGEKFSGWARKEEKVEVIYNGIDLEEFNPGYRGQNIRKNFNWPRNIPLVGIIGELTPKKGHHYFLEAAAQVLKEIPETKFLIVGSDPPRRGCGKEIKSLAKKLGLAEKVIFLGYQEEIRDILISLSLLVHCPRWEGFGRVLVEAMACGKPVVATRVGGIPEIVEDKVTGLLVSAENPEALAKAIIALLQDKEKACRLGMAGRKRAEKMFDIEESVKKTEKVYENLLGTNKTIS